MSGRIKVLRLKTAVTAYNTPEESFALMFQFNMCVDNRNVDWFESIEKSLGIKMRSLDGVVAAKAGKNRMNISVACESARRTEAAAVIRETLREMYLTVCKLKYLQQCVRIPSLAEESYQILLHTLVAFDREAETEIVDKRLNEIGDFVSLDGFFHFKLAALRTRWDEVARLASGNSMYLTREDTLNELLKFLLSAVAPRIQKLQVRFHSGVYSVSGEYQKSLFEFRTGSGRQLLIYLINFAPVELVLDGEFQDEQLYRRIISIFDGKPVTRTV